MRLRHLNRKQNPSDNSVKSFYCCNKEKDQVYIHGEYKMTGEKLLKRIVGETIEDFKRDYPFITGDKSYHVK